MKNRRSYLSSALAVLVALGAYFLCLSLPLPRQVGLNLRYSFYLAMLVLVLGGYLSYRLPGWLGDILALTFTLLAFALPLSGLWTSGQSEQYILGGIFPWSDAANYYFDGLRALEGNVFTPFSASRPVFPAFFAAILGFTHANLQQALMLVNLVPAFATYLAVREFQRTEGALPAAVFLGIGFLFFRRYIGASLSEVLGYALGLVAFAFLWDCGSRKSGRMGLAGIFLLTLALNTRNGSFFVLPLVLLWLGWLLRGNQKLSYRYLVFGLVMVAAGFLVPRFLSLLMTDPKDTASYHLGMQVYSLVTGSRSWFALFDDYPQLSTLPSAEILRQSIHLSVQYLKVHPLDTVKGVFVDWGSYFLDADRGGYSYLSGTSAPMSEIARLVVFGLGLAGLIAWLRDRKKPVMLLLALGSLGNFLSMPVVPPLNTYGLRLFAATIWVDTALPAVGVAALVRLFSKGRLQRLCANILSTRPGSSTGLVIFPAILVPLMVVGPLLIRATSRPTDLAVLQAKASCPPPQQAVVTRLVPGSYLILKKTFQIENEFLPTFRLFYVKDNIHNMGTSTIFPEFDRLDGSTALIYGLDLVTKQKRLIFAPLEIFPSQRGLVMVCGNNKTDSEFYISFFFFAKSMIPLEK